MLVQLYLAASIQVCMQCKLLKPFDVMQTASLTACLDCGVMQCCAFAGSTFESMLGLGGALRLFIAALWLDSTLLLNNSAQAIAEAIFFNQSCIQVGCSSCIPDQPSTQTQQAVKYTATCLLSNF